MSFLTPWALLWLGSLPVLFWLWWMTASRHRVLVPSLIPFEHLLQRRSTRRTRLIVNVLFWLQLAALISMSVALAQPVLLPHRSTVTLAVLDTSASMQAMRYGSTRFARAKSLLLQALLRKHALDRWLIMTTAPNAPLVPEPTSDAVVLQRALDAAHAVDIGGNLAATVRMGHALLGITPTKTLIITDEARPTDETSPWLEWKMVGQPQANVALVGLETTGPLCEPSPARILATVQNFSTTAAHVNLRVRQRSTLLVEQSTSLAPHERWPASLTLPKGIEGWVELSLTTQGDALAVDNRAWVQVQRTSMLPIVIQSARPTLTQTLSTWLSACPALTWSAEPSHLQGPWLLITDHESSPGQGAASTLTFLPPQMPRSVLSQWVVLSEHPIGSYVEPIDTVASTLNLSDAAGLPGTPVIQALVDGRRIPVVLADEHDGRRSVIIRVEPDREAASTPVMLVFLNSLRWLMESTKMPAAGEPLTAHGFAPGQVTIRDPDGATHTIPVEAGVARYDHADRAGMYELIQSDRQRTVAVNFLDPLESNLADPSSTWATNVHASPKPGERSSQTRVPLGRWLIALLLALLLMEWWLYSGKRRVSVGSQQKAVGRKQKAETRSLVR